MFSRVILASLAAALVASGGCASKSTSEAAQAGTPQPRRSSSVITADEITETGAQTVHQAVQILRPQWFRVRQRATMSGAAARGGGTRDPIVVYLDQNKYGTVNSLQQLTIVGVREIRFYDGTQATNRFGTGHSNGAIVVVMGK